MIRFRIAPYNLYSAGAHAVAEALRAAGHAATVSNNGEADFIINWGKGESGFSDEVLNYNIDVVLNKARFFERLVGGGITPQFSTTRSAALESLRFPIFCRTRLEGRDGQGIVVADSPDTVVDARLYVEGVDKTAEYRVHAGRLPDGTIVILGGHKKTRREREGVDPRIWAGDRTNFGSYFREADFPHSVRAVVMRAMEKLEEFTFLAFDVAFVSEYKAYVLEANSAPMMTPYTATDYAKFFIKYAEQQREAEREAAVQWSTEDFEQRIAQVFDDLNRERISIRTIIEGYLMYQSENP